MSNVDIILDIVKDIRSTLQEFQHQQNELNKRVSHSEIMLEEIRSKITIHETKLAELETKERKAQGVLIFIGFIIPIVVAILGIIF